MMFKIDLKGYFKINIFLYGILRFLFIVLFKKKKIILVLEYFNDIMELFKKI